MTFVDNYDELMHYLKTLDNTMDTFWAIDLFCILCCVCKNVSFAVPTRHI